MASPPEFEVLTNPGWLTLFVAILVGYKPAKDSIKEAMSDASSILSTIDGLTQDQIRALTIGTKRMMERILEVTQLTAGVCRTHGSDESPSFHVLSFHAFTKCKFRNPFVLIFIQNARGYPQRGRASHAVGFLYFVTSLLLSFAFSQ